MDNVHTLHIIRQIVHHGLLLVGSIFLISALLLVSKTPILSTEHALLLYQFLLMPTFFLFIIDVGLTVYHHIVHKTLQLTSPQTTKTFALGLIGTAIFFTLLFYVL